MKYHNAAQPVYNPYEGATFSTSMSYAHYVPNQPAPKAARCSDCNGHILYPSTECGECGKPYCILGEHCRGCQGCK